MRKTAGVLVIILGAVSAWFSVLFVGFSIGLGIYTIWFWFLLWIPLIVCSVFIFKAKFWVACFIMSVLFGGIIPAIFIILAKKDWGKDTSIQKGVGILLAVLNIIAFIVLAALYYGGFIVQWGHTALAIKWGLPMAVISLFALLAAIFALIKANWKLGIIGLGAVVIVIVYMNILLNSYSYVLLPAQTSNETPTVENKIITQVIQDYLMREGDYKENCYTIVNPYTRCIPVDSHAIEGIKGYSNEYGYDFATLLKRLVEINQTSVRLDINSSISDGYCVDYDYAFSRYYDRGYTHGSLGCRLFRPQILGFATVSLPAYDSETGYVMMCVDIWYRAYTQSGGNVSIYRYIDGNLTFIGHYLYFLEPAYSR